MGFVVALRGAFCASASTALLNAPVIAPAPITAEALRNLRLDMSGL